MDLEAMTDPYLRDDPLAQACKMTPTYYQIKVKAKNEIRKKGQLQYLYESEDELDQELEDKYIDKMLNVSNDEEA